MPDNQGQPTEITFHYIKSNQYRVVHADGVWGGLTPRGLLQLNFYSERRPIPKQTVHPLSPEGRVGDDEKDRRVARDGLVREIEVGAMVDLATARSLHKWLGEKIDELEKAIADAKSKGLAND